MSNRIQVISKTNRIEDKSNRIQVKSKTCQSEDKTYQKQVISKTSYIKYKSYPTSHIEHVILNVCTLVSQETDSPCAAAVEERKGEEGWLVL